MPTERYSNVSATQAFVQRLWRKAAATSAKDGGPPPAAGSEPPVDIAGTLCRIMHNGFGVRDARGAEVGCALVPTASMFNHACLPTCQQHTRLGGERGGRALDFVTTRRVLAGEQLTISYVEADLPREERRAKLRESYYFDCMCVACQQLPATPLRRDPGPGEAKRYRGRAAS
mmetsp:Transcript_29485/g.67630  ORF Transcript_29485/g.67630 Transcript_29485/m.67630 type:complete len:173 (+) Transcript_29485:49-567(+)